MSMIRLRVPPDSYDENGQPCYEISQRKGLREYEGDELLLNAYAGGYTDHVHRKLFWKVTQHLNEETAVDAPDVLEVGGGDGSFFEMIKDRVRSYTNLDPGKQVLDEKARVRLKDPRYLNLGASAEDIPLFDDAVDVVVSIASLDHIPNPQMVLREIARVLKPGGLFVLVLNNRGSWWKQVLKRTEYLKRREAVIEREHYFQWSVRDCRKHLEAEFDVRSLYTTTFVPFIPRLWRLVLPIADAVGSRLMPNKGANLIAVSRPRARSSAP